MISFQVYSRKGYFLIGPYFVLSVVDSVLIGWFICDVMRANPFSLTVPIYRCIAEGAALAAGKICNK